MRPLERVRRSLARIEEADRPEVWISRRRAEEVLSDAEAVERRLDAGEKLPLAGLTVAVKDNIDHAAAPTTAACPAYSYRPRQTAPAVARLEAAGAIVLGKTNLDQFATGLVGTRTPHGAVRDARRPLYISGGSSSGSAVAVALGMADLGVGTDTAGSGRVPAAFAGIFGVKPTRGLVPTGGVVPACRTLDCVTVFARELSLAQLAIAIMAAPPARPWPADAPLGAPAGAAVAVPHGLPDLEDDAREIFAAAVERLRAAGRPVLEIDVQPFLEAGGLLYNGAYVAERYAAVGRFIDLHPGAVDPTVRSIVHSAGRIAAHTLVSDGERLEELRRRARAEMGEAVALLLPTTTRQPLIVDVADDPFALNARLGVFTSFANLFDMCAVALPAGQAGEEQFGVQVLGWAFADAVVAEVAAEIGRGGRERHPVPALAQPGPPSLRPPEQELFVLGAHRLGQPLNHQLTARGAVLRRIAATAPEYRMHRLDTEPPKPGLRRSEPDGVAIEGEVWALPRAAFGDFVAALPPPMAIGPVRLADGTHVPGFLCEAGALEHTEDISACRSWLAYLAA